MANVGRRLLMGAGAGAGVFVAAAAMATSSAAPAKADLDALIDPIIQPIVNSLTESLTAFDPSAAVDLTSWTDSFLSSLNSIDLALPSTDSALAAAASSAEPAQAATTLSDVSIPVTMMEGSEPTVGATVDGAGTTLLVDTGSSGLVIPDTDLGSNFLTQLEALFQLGTPTGFGEGGYSGGVDYLYLTYDAPVDYTSTTGAAVDTTVPVEVEVYSWDPSDPLSFFTNNAFQEFDASNEVTGILGIGTTGTGGVGESPIEAAGYNGVTVDLPGKELTFDGAANDGGTQLTAAGSTVSGLTETVSKGGTVLGTATGVSDDLDSGGVYGTIPSSIAGSGSLEGDTISVYDGNTLLYSYPVTADSVGTDETPIATSGTSIDSGVIPFENAPISIDYTSGDLYLQ
jgi:hypothetical protein